MPLPFILFGIGTAAAGWGMKKGIAARDDARKARELNRDATDAYADAEKILCGSRIAALAALEGLGRLKLDVWNHDLTRLVRVYGQLHPIEMINGVDIDAGRKPVAVHALGVLVKSYSSPEHPLRGSAMALGAGTLAGVAAYGSAAMFGAASTGTAISTLAGAAATNATLAWFGGGALTAGGFGMAGGVAVLGGVVAGPALAVGGVLWASMAQENLAKSRVHLAKAVKAGEAMRLGARILDEIEAAATQLTRVIADVRRRFGALLDARPRGADCELRHRLSAVHRGGATSRASPDANHTDPQGATGNALADAGRSPAPGRLACSGRGIEVVSRGATIVREKRQDRVTSTVALAAALDGGLRAATRVLQTDSIVLGMQDMARAAERLSGKGVEFLKGDLFEYIEAAKFNAAAAAVKGPDLVAKLTRDAHQPHASADILILQNGRVIREVQAKVSKGTEELTGYLRQPKYHGMQKLVPSDKAQAVKLRAEFRARYWDERGAPHLARENLDTAENVTGALHAGGASSGGTTTKETTFAARNPRVYRFHVESKHVLDEALLTTARAAATGALIQGSISAVKQAILVARGDVSKRNAARQVAADTALGGVRSGAVGAVGTAVRYGALRAGVDSLSKTNVATSLAAAPHRRRRDHSFVR